VKEELKISCTRCHASVLFESGTDELKRLGWAGVMTSVALGNFTLCPHCVHECKRFLAGCEIRKL